MLHVYAFLKISYTNQNYILTLLTKKIFFSVSNTFFFSVLLLFFPEREGSLICSLSSSNMEDCSIDEFSQAAKSPSREGTKKKKGLGSLLRRLGLNPFQIRSGGGTNGV